jgi:hypothetical protein
VKPLLILLFTLLYAQAEYKAIEGKYDFFQAKVACQKFGKDWRVPEIWELFPLRGQSAKYGKDRRYWSANALGEARVVKMIRHENEFFVNSKDIPAFSFYLQDGDIGPTPKHIQSHLICTNQTKHLPSDEGLVLEDEGVFDHHNEILWAPLSSTTLNLKMDYETAKTYCEDSSLDNRSWRLPTLKELYSIVNYNYIKPAVNKAIWGDMQRKYYLSNTLFDDQTVYVVGFSVGSVATSYTQNQSYFRCVSDFEDGE